MQNGAFVCFLFFGPEGYFQRISPVLFPEATMYMYMSSSKVHVLVSLIPSVFFLAKTKEII